MFLALDIIVVVIFAATLINCIRRGFVRSVLSLLKSVIAVVVSYMFTPALAEYFKKAFISDAITEPVKERLNVMLTETAGKFNIEKLFADKPKEFLDILSRFGVKLEDFADSYGVSSQASEEYVSSLAQDITAPVVNTVANILAFIGLFVGALIILSIAILILSAVVKLPVIRGIDKLLGTVFGLASGLVLAFSFAGLAKVGFEALASVSPDTFGGVIEKTVVVKFLGSVDFGQLFIK